MLLGKSITVELRKYMSIFSNVVVWFINSSLLRTFIHRKPRSPPQPPSNFGTPIHPSFFLLLPYRLFFPRLFSTVFFSTLTAKYAFYLYTCIHYFSDNHQVINTAMLGPIPKLRSNLVRIEYSRGVYLKCVNGGFDCFERGFLFGFSVLHVVLKQDEKYTHRSTLERINNNKVLHNNHRITS